MARRPKNDPAVLKRNQQELDRSRKWRRTEEIDDLWRRMVDLYAGKHYDKQSSSDRMVVNRAFKTKNVISPSIAVNNPKFLVNARTPDKGPHAIVVEEIINYMWRTHRYQDEFRAAVDDALIVGHGWLKIGYKFKAERVEVKHAPIDDERDHDETEPGVDDREDVEGNVESEVKIVDDRPFVERISFFDMFVDPDARNLGEARWIAQRIRRNVADVQVDRRYDGKCRDGALVRNKVKATQRDGYDPGDEDERESLTGNAASKGFVDIYEYYDLREGTVATFCTEVEDGYLKAPEKVPYPFPHPFEMIRNYNVPDKFYPVGDLEAIEVLQRELNKTRTEQMLHRRANQRKYIAKPGAFDSKGMTDLQSDEDGIIVEMASVDMDPSEAIAVMPSHTIAADLYNMSDIISNDIDDTTGVTDFGDSSIRRTATEAAMIQDQLNARASDKLAQIELALARVGEKLIQLLQTFMRGEQVIRIVGSEAAPMWLTYDKDYIQGKFDFEVEAGSTQPRNESFRAQRAMQLMDAMAPFLQMGVADPVAVMRKILQDGFGVKDASVFIAQQGQMAGMPPEGGAEMPPGLAGAMAPQPPVNAPPPEMMEESPVDGIPPELMARVEGFNPSPVNQV